MMSLDEVVRRRNQPNIQVLANAILPSMMSAIGISELPMSFVVQTVLIASGGMLLTGLFACGVPARRALCIEPTEAVKIRWMNRRRASHGADRPGDVRQVRATLM